MFLDPSGRREVRIYLFKTNTPHPKGDVNIKKKGPKKSSKTQAEPLWKMETGVS